jgi:hypothetical protein
MTLQKYTKIVCVLGLLVLTFVIMLNFPNHDWKKIFHPAAVKILRFENPFDIPGYMNPIWVAALLTPFTIFSPEISRGLFGVVSMLAYLFLCYKLKVGFLSAALIVPSASVLQAILQSNVEPVLLLGVLLPPAFGLPLIMGKPQVGIGYLVYQLYWSFREKTLLATLTPFAVLILWNLPYTPAMLAASQRVVGTIRNESLFPYAAPLGLFLLWLAIRQKKPALTIAASVFFSPYVVLYSYVGIQIAVAAYGGKYKNWLLAVLLLVSWWMYLY